MLNRRSFVAVSGSALLLGCSTGRSVSIPPDTTLIILRHADRDDQQLSEKGRERSKALVGALTDFEIDAIYAPDIKRNLDTAAPLATARGQDILRVERFDAVDAFLQVVQTSGGRNVVWVGNKDNLTPIWDALSLDGPPPLEYGDLFVVDTRSSSLPRVTRLQFGTD